MFFIRSCLINDVSINRVHMYDLPDYRESDEQIIRDFIAQYPFAFISGCDAENKPVATQIPVFIEERNGRKLLRGHMMKHTDHHRAFLHNENVLTVFTGKHTYVSATWYSSPNIPSTWNYMSVHVQGVIRFLDERGLEEVLRSTTLHFEDQNEASATVFQNLPTEMTRRLMQAIVAFEIDIKKMDAIFKLSQDRDAESYMNIIKKLEDQDEDGRVIAAAMQKRFKRQFPDHG